MRSRGTARLALAQGGFTRNGEKERGKHYPKGFAGCVLWTGGKRSPGKKNSNGGEEVFSEIMRPARISPSGKKGL